jgi:hypothetical protein
VSLPAAGQHQPDPGTTDSILLYCTSCYSHSTGISYGVSPIDMRSYLDRPQLFPLCAGCVPFELVISAALLGGKNGGWEGVK